MLELRSVLNGLGPLSDAIQEIKPSNDTPRGRFVRRFRDDLKYMLRILSEFTVDVLSCVGEFDDDMDPYRLCQEIRETWEANLPEMELADRTAENWKIIERMREVPAGQHEDHKFLLTIYLKIYVLLR